MREGDVNQFRDQMNASVVEGIPEISGFKENATAAFSVFMNEDTSVSEYLQEGKYKSRDRSIDRKIQNGEIPSAEVNPHVDEDGDIDYGRLAYHLKRRNYDVMDDYDVRDSIRANLKRDREFAAEIHGRAGAGGTAGIFLGQMAAAQLDPINAAAMLIPPLAMARTASALARVGQTALYYGATTAATETAIQASFVRDWKGKIGVEHTAGDALEAIAFAGIGGAVIGTAAQVGGEQVVKGFKKLRNKIELDRTMASREKSLLIRQQEAALDEFQWHVRLYERERILARMQRAREADAAWRKAVVAQAEAQGDEITMEDWQDIFDEYAQDEALKILDGGLSMPDVSLAQTIKTVDNYLEGIFKTAKERHLQAAKDLGYDINTKWYRGARHPDNLGVTPEGTIYLTQDAEYAVRYAMGYSARHGDNKIPSIGRYYVPDKPPIDIGTDPAMIEDFRIWLQQEYNADLDANGLIPAGFHMDELFGEPVPGGFDPLIKEGHPIPWQVVDDFVKYLDVKDIEWTHIKVWEGDSGNAVGDVSLLIKQDYAKPGSFFALDNYKADHPKFLEDDVLDMTPPRKETTPVSLDDQTARIAEDIEDLNDMQVEKMMEEDQTYIYADKDPEPDAVDFGDLDAEKYATMSQEQKDAWLQRVLGEEGESLDDIMMATGEIDGDGNLMYKTRKEILDDVDEDMAAMEAFATCWTGV